MQRLAIAQVNVSGGAGGAEGVAVQLHRAYLRRGHDASLLVGRGAATGQGVRGFPSDWWTRALHLLAGPLRIADRHRGRETFRYPATRGLLASFEGPPDVLHLHNLHGGYFDLRVLPELCAAVPVVLTLHDAWLLSGHCAHSFDCERWRTGCGSCPDLTIYPSVRVDDTAANWQRKRAIFAGARLHVATPSAWLAARVEASMLAPSIETLRVIPNGVDLHAFTPGDRHAARRELGVPDDVPLLLFVAKDARTNPFKDMAVIERAAALAAERIDRDVTVIILGDTGPDVKCGAATIRFIPFQDATARVARYYQAADLLVHAAHADTFPTTVIEAMACGTPVVATAVGGIPEQVRSLTASADGSWPAQGADRATGVLVGRGDAGGMGAAIAALLQDDPLRLQLGRNAARAAATEYDIKRQCDTYIDWYRSILRRPRLPVTASRETSHATSDDE
jgi:glycosyltransferase involved in cell wall biosynthesis